MASRQILSAVVALAFACFAVLQLNDPDPIRWFLIYGSIVVVSVASIFGHVPKLVFAGLAGVAGLWALSLLPGVLSAAALTGTEEERELTGLILVVVASALLARPGAGARGSPVGPSPSNDAA